MSDPVIPLLQTRVGLPSLIGRTPSGGPVYSSINRQLVHESRLYLTPTGLSGDQVSNSAAKPDGGQIHGGADKAVYAYPQAHYPAWHKLIGPPGMRGRSLGENWCLGEPEGLGGRPGQSLEELVHIGDIWQLGTAVLQVTKPRTPCATLVRYYGGAPLNRLMWRSGRCGWYLRVLTPGEVPTTGQLVVVHRELAAPTVADRFDIKRQQQPAGRSTVRRR